MEKVLRVGMCAPEFKSKAYKSGGFVEISSQNFRGRWLCLFFYPLDFTFVCPTELRAFSWHEPKFLENNCDLIACSTDSEYSHKAWFEKDLPDVKFPVIADTNHKVSRDFGVLIEERGITLRGTFLIDPNGILQSMSINSLEVGRSVEEILRTLQALKTGELCPVEWKPGLETL